MNGGLAHEWFVEHRQAFVGRHLEPEEERVFGEHLRGCAECRDAVATLERELGWLGMGVRPVAPRPGFTREISDAVLRPAPAPWRQWAPLAAAAGLVLALGLGWRGAQRRAAGLEAELAVVPGPARGGGGHAVRGADARAASSMRASRCTSTWARSPSSTIR